MGKKIENILKEEETLPMMTQKEIVATLAEEYNLAPNKVRKLFEGLGILAADQLSQKNIGQFLVPGVGVKLAMKPRSAREARQGRNPATGEVIMIAARPARKVIKASVQKRLKDRVEAIQS